MKKVLLLSLATLGIATVFSLNSAHAAFKALAKSSQMTVTRADKGNQYLKGYETVSDVEIKLGTRQKEADSMKVSFVNHGEQKKYKLRVIKTERSPEGEIKYYASYMFPGGGTCPAFFKVEMTEKDRVWKAKLGVFAMGPTPSFEVEGPVESLLRSKLP